MEAGRASALVYTQLVNESMEEIRQQTENNENISEDNIKSEL